MLRGSNTGLDPSQCPPRKWFSLSGDGGLTWSGVRDIRYDTGEQLFSPASIFRVIRSTKTGKLYFVGNITESPPDGNSPRYPLQIVEIDEESIDSLPRRWRVTSDSIAARMARVFRARELVLLKSVTFPERISMSEAAELGLVDEYFPTAARDVERVVAINLRSEDPEESALYSVSSQP